MPTKRARTAASSANGHAIHLHLNSVQVSSMPGAEASSSSAAAPRPIPYHPTAYMDLRDICPSPKPTQKEGAANVTEDKEN